MNKYFESNYTPVVVLESEQQLIILATKPTKKTRNIIFIFVRFRGFRGHQLPIKEIKFLYRLDWTLAASGSACMKINDKFE